MVTLGLVFTLLSGIANGLFTAPMKIMPSWKWENIWLVFIVTACIAMPLAMTLCAVGNPAGILAALPGPAVTAALAFGFAWGFGSIMFGLSVHTLGVSLANSMVIGLSSAAGSVVPLLISGAFRVEPRQVVLLAGVAVFLAGVGLCTKAGRLREGALEERPSIRGYLFAVGSGIMSAVFNIGYSLALPIADAGAGLGISRFSATNLIWLLMLGAGSLPNIALCSRLLARNRTAGLFRGPSAGRNWALSMLMGLLWGGSIYLYGAATPLLGDIGPSIGWPLSLAVGLLVANLMGVLLGEWRAAPPRAVRFMWAGILTLLAAIVMCGLSTRLGVA